MDEKKTKVLSNFIWVVKAICRYDKKYIFILSLTTAIFAILPSITTLVSQNIINNLQQHSNIHLLIELIVIYVAIDFVQAVLGYLVDYYKYNFSLGFNLHVRNRVLEKSARLTLKDYENSEMYDMISRAQYEAEGKLLNYFELFVGIFASFITTISYLVIIVQFRKWIVLVIMIIPVAKFIINKSINLKKFSVLIKRTNDSRKCWYMQHLITNGEAYKELSVYNLFSYFINRYVDYSKRFNREDLNLKKKESMQMGSASLLEAGIDGGLFSYVILRCASGEIMIGNVTAYMKAIGQVKSQITAALQMASGVSQESLYIDQLQLFMMLPEERMGQEGYCTVDEIETIQVSHLYYRYKEQEVYVLQDVNFTIRKGESIAVVGQNGSGKTTLLKILMGFYKDYEGDVYINGIELRQICSREIMKHIATLFQDFFQYEATFRENIAYGNLEKMQDDGAIMEICK